MITDAEALYDASRSESAGLGLEEKRTAIELAILNERMSEMKAVWRWTNTTQQVADGLTKISGRTDMAYVLRRGYHALKFDPEFKAGEKLSLKEKQAQEVRLEELAAEQTGANPHIKRVATPCEEHGPPSVPSQCSHRALAYVFLFLVLPPHVLH